MVFSWFKSEQRERRRKVKLDRKHLEARSRRFLKNYLNADETRKPQILSGRRRRHLSNASQRDQVYRLPN
jgi:hypothetical protein